MLAAVFVLFWPNQQSRSLAIKAVNWAADPSDNLPHPPADFSMEDGEDTAVVIAHDDQEAEYEKAYATPGLEGIRIRLRDMPEPFDPTTQQQVLAAMLVLGGLLVWRLGGRPARGSPPDQPK